MSTKNIKKKIFFSKMHGIGNDFVIINNIKKQQSFSASIIKYISHRNYGIGCDQVLLIEKSFENGVDFFYRIFNSNGSEVSQCGNGARCVAYYVFKKKIIKKTQICIRTYSSLMYIKIFNENRIEVNMGIPIFKPKKIPFLYKKKKKKYSLIIANKKIYCGVVSVGNPHCIIQVKNFNDLKINKLGKLISSCNYFPESINVSFMQIIDKSNIFLRVYERHVGETKACGSAACAAVAVGKIQNLLLDNVTVNLLGGILNISWNGIKNNLYMTGPVKYVYDGVIVL